MGIILSKIKDKSNVPLNILGAILYVVDVYSDVALAAEYYASGDTNWASATIALVAIPWLLYIPLSFLLWLRGCQPKYRFTFIASFFNLLPPALLLSSV